MIRTGLRRRPDSVLGQFIAVKSKVCQNCKRKFTPDLPGAIACSEDCAIAYAVSVNGKARKVAAVRERKAKMVDRRETKQKLEKLKTRAQWLKEAKTAIQRFRRLEELALGSGCISCNRTQSEVADTDAWKPGGAWDGGHFLSKGARPELALEPLNIWLQCKSCNAGSSKYARKGYTVGASFRLNLIERIGLEAVEALEVDQGPKHYSTDEIIAIKTEYAAKARALLKART